MKFLSFLLLAIPVFAQQYNPGNYLIYTKSDTGATSQKITIQQPASNANTVRLMRAFVSCSVACTVTFTVNGTAASSTAATALFLNPTVNPRIANKALVYASSNVGGGTTQATYPIGAAGSMVFDLNNYVLGPAGTTNNFTINIASASGDYVTTLMWVEL